MEDLMPVPAGYTGDPRIAEIVLVLEHRWDGTVVCKRYSSSMLSSLAGSWICTWTLPKVVLPPGRMTQPARLPCSSCSISSRATRSAAPRMHSRLTDSRSPSPAGSSADGFDREMPPDLRNFFYLPFTHSEHLPDQEISLRERHALGPTRERRAAEHLTIIQRFGRFPHRNAALGRGTTKDEAAYLAGGGFAG